MEDCENKEEFDYQSTKAWYLSNGLDYDLLNSPTLQKLAKEKRTLKTVKSETDNEKTVKKVVTFSHDDYRRFYSNAKSNFSHYLKSNKEDDRKLQNCKKYLQLLIDNGYDCKIEADKLTIPRYNKEKHIKIIS